VRKKSRNYKIFRRSGCLEGIPTGDAAGDKVPNRVLDHQAHVFALSVGVKSSIVLGSGVWISPVQNAVQKWSGSEGISRK